MHISVLTVHFVSETLSVCAVFYHLVIQSIEMCLQDCDRGVRRSSARRKLRLESVNNEITVPSDPPSCEDHYPNDCCDSPLGIMYLNTFMVSSIYMQIDINNQDP